MAKGLPIDNIMRDPLQGYDIKVHTASAGRETPTLVGAFTSLMFKVVNQTETYLPLNSRIPRMLDGEIIVVWSLEQGLIQTDIINNTFGTQFKTGFEGSRGTLIPRSQRFDIITELNSPDLPAAAGATVVADAGFNATSNTKYGTKLKVTLAYCRVDTYSFGVTAGRHVVANAWQGTCQHIVVETDAK